MHCSLQLNRRGDDKQWKADLAAPIHSGDPKISKGPRHVLVIHVSICHCSKQSLSLTLHQISKRLEMLKIAALALLLGPLFIKGAPQEAPAPERSVKTGENAFLLQVNPFGSTEENRSLLKSFIKANLNEQANPDVSSWEQEVFFLFSLFDFDKSGQLDGLELMKLLSDFLAHHSQSPGSGEEVVGMVDHLLQTQDQNQDGLLVPSELFSPPGQHGGETGPGPDVDSAPGAAPDSQPKEEDNAPEQTGVDEGETAERTETDGLSDTPAEQQTQPQEEVKNNDQEKQSEERQNQEDQIPMEQEESQGEDGTVQNQENNLEPVQELAEPEVAQQEHQQQTGEQQQQHHAPVHQGQPEI